MTKKATPRFVRTSILRAHFGPTSVATIHRWQEADPRLAPVMRTPTGDPLYDLEVWEQVFRENAEKGHQRASVTNLDLSSRRQGGRRAVGDE